MSDDSSQLSKVKFSRDKHVPFTDDITSWGDNNFPSCPLCKKRSLWEWGAKNVPFWKMRMWGNKSPRIYFRCPNCMGVISVETYVVRKWRLLPVSLFKHEDAKIESIGNNSGLQHIVGQKYPIKTLQGWTSQANEKKET